MVSIDWSDYKFTIVSEVVDTLVSDPKGTKSRFYD